MFVCACIVFVCCVCVVVLYLRVCVSLYHLLLVRCRSFRRPFPASSPPFLPSFLPLFLPSSSPLHAPSIGSPMFDWLAPSLRVGPAHLSPLPPRVVCQATEKVILLLLFVQRNSLLTCLSFSLSQSLSLCLSISLSLPLILCLEFQAAVSELNLVIMLK